MSAILFYLALGACTGCLAGLLGVGGGLLIVPGLVWFFTAQGVPVPAMQFAVGTSMAVMVFTSASAFVAHWRHQNIAWNYYRPMLPGILAGVLVGAALAHVLRNAVLQQIFGGFLLLISVRMLRGTDRSHPAAHPGTHVWFLRLVSPLIGLLSGLLGVGGGAFSVPALTHCGVPLKPAIGTSSAFTFPVAVMGVLAYALFPAGERTLAGTTGYVYWPAVLALAPCTMLFAPLGARLTQRLPIRAVRSAFAVVVLMLGIRMLLR